MKREESCAFYHNLEERRQPGPWNKDPFNKHKEIEENESKTLKEMITTNMGRAISENNILENKYHYTVCINHKNSWILNN